MEAEKWGRRIRAYRKLKGYTQESFSRQLGVSVSILGEIERGNRLPAGELLERIAHSLKITIDDLTPKE
ncbi:helix-turn-helix transcriptional regulator [Neobacillus drentensis]|uniref:helix-turn-helix domain-containing protein n=1 Tax=Bacillales TaxID=1385 RepID=UPI0025AEE22B|nr:helix-turn-helix transcriptional regulator [Paenibacillus sp. BSR1-1]MDN3019963.1 helix-turn-helix transcriptional regulator [Paenibacillus sp. BSR1-1]